MAMPTTAPATRPAEKIGLIDCDVHNAVPSDAALRSYLPARWRSYMDLVGSRTYSPYVKGFPYPKVSPGGGSRLDAWPPSGALPGSDLDFMRQQLLDPHGIRIAILNCLYRAAEQRNEDYGAALARAVNEWQVEHWLEPEPRLRASITVAYETPDLAAQEITRAAQHPGFVQVLLFRRAKEPLGKRRYWPLYEAAVEAGLPIGIHFASTTAAPTTAAGWPSYYIEDHTVMSMAFQAQLTSLVIEGVRALPRPAHRVGRGWVRVAAAAHVAARRPVPPDARRGAAPAAAAFGVRERARRRDDAADRGTGVPATCST